MNTILSTVIELLPLYGPGLVFVLAILETCFVTGVVVPSGLATSAATVLALQGRLELTPMVVAAVFGGATGDSLGYWIGRGWGNHLLRQEGRWARLLGRRRDVVDELFERHPLYSVTAARLIAFVRTLAPMAAGMSGLPYRRYLAFEVVGVLLWAALYVTIGLVAGEGWHRASQVVGAGTALVFVVVGLVAWRAWRRRTAGPAGTEAS